MKSQRKKSTIQTCVFRRNIFVKLSECKKAAAIGFFFFILRVPLTRGSSHLSFARALVYTHFARITDPSSFLSPFFELRQNKQEELEAEMKALESIQADRRKQQHSNHPSHSSRDANKVFVNNKTGLKQSLEDFQWTNKANWFDHLVVVGENREES